MHILLQKTTNAMIAISKFIVVRLLRAQTHCTSVFFHNKTNNVLKN